ncbi:MAG: CoA transferase [Gammaproteobacteria bacterium]|nr:CoA transferase [Gammaproteobacteria bacterium]
MGRAGGDIVSVMPLQGIRVVDMTHSWAGPHCTRVLADYGAEVIRVEFPGRLCMFRGGRVEDQAYDKQTNWYQINRNKHSVTLDLNESLDQGLLKDLVKCSDIFIENSRPGVLEKFGFAYNDLVKLNPTIVMLSMSAFGSYGPYTKYCAYGAVMEAVGGIQSLTAYGPDGKPQRICEMDVVNGVGAANAILTALLYREESGEGQRIDFSQTEFPTHALIGEHLLEHSINGSHRPPQGNRHHEFAPQGCYPCLGNDEWVALTIRCEEEWRGLCKALGQTGWLNNNELAKPEGRQHMHAELDAEISTWTRQRSPKDAMQLLQSHGIPAAAVLDVSELDSDPHLQAREFFLTEEQPPGQRFMGMPFHLSGIPEAVHWRGPDLGEYNAELVTKVLKRNEEDTPSFEAEKLCTAYD